MPRASMLRRWRAFQIILVSIAPYYKICIAWLMAKLSSFNFRTPIDAKKIKSIKKEYIFKFSLALALIVASALITFEPTENESRNKNFWTQPKRKSRVESVGHHYCSTMGERLNTCLALASTSCTVHPYKGIYTGFSSEVHTEVTAKGSETTR